MAKRNTENPKIKNAQIPSSTENKQWHLVQKTAENQSWHFEQGSKIRYVTLKDHLIIFFPPHHLHNIFFLLPILFTKRHFQLSNVQAENLFSLDSISQNLRYN